MKKTISPARFLVIGFLSIILLGAVILMLPISSASGQYTPFVDTLFTSTSAVCVTGLVVVDTGTYWSNFGRLVIIILIQIGGLGFMTVTTFGAILIGKKIGIKNRILMKESLGQDNLQGIVYLAKKIMIGTFIIEFIGGLLLSTQFIPAFGFVDGLAKGMFHSISAFCNAGFDTMGQFSSLMNFQLNPTVNFTIMALIVLGGIGFTVIFDFISNKKFKRLSLHSKIVITMTIFLILSGTIIFYVLERANPQTMGPMNELDKMMASAFQSISPRTAGFNTINQADMTDSSIFMTILLMFVGGSPASTAGGIKTTTLAVIILAAVGFVRNKDVEAFGRRINYSLVNKALTIIVIALFVIIVSTMLLSIENPDINFLWIIYEVVSAFGTVGLSTGITPTLTVLSKIVLIMAMFAGRVGTLTIIMALSRRRKTGEYQLPEGNVIL